MSLELSNSPGKPEIKMWFDNTLRIRNEETEIQVSIKDLPAMIYYSIVNTPLVENDPRLTLLKVLSRLEVRPGSIGSQFFYKDKEAFSLVYPGDYPSEQ